MKKQSIACFAPIAIIGFLAIIGSCQAPVQLQGNMGSVNVSLALTGGIPQTKALSPAAGASARWLNPNAQFAHADLYDSTGKIAFSAQGSIINHNGNQLFQLTGVKPGSGYRLLLSLYQDASMGNPLGSAIVDNLPIMPGQNQPIAVVVVPTVSSSQTLNSFSNLANYTVTTNQLINNRTYVFAVTLPSVPTGYLQPLQLVDAGLSTHILPELTILDSSGKIIGKCVSGCGGNGAFFWVNPSTTPVTYYVVVNLAGYTVNAYINDSSSFTANVYYLPQGSGYQLSWSSPNYADPNITFQILVGNSTDITQAAVIADYYPTANLTRNFSSGQHIWIYYRYNGQLVGLISDYAVN